MKRLTDCSRVGSCEAAADLVCFFPGKFVVVFLKELFYWVTYPWLLLSSNVAVLCRT